MFGTRFATQPLWGGSLFGAGLKRASDASRANSEIPLPASDLKKFQVTPNPIEREAQNPNLEPTPPWLNKATAAARAKWRGGLESEELSAIKKLEAKRKYEAIEQEQRENYYHDFKNWIIGLGKKEDYERAGITQFGQGKWISRHPEVQAYIDAGVDRRARYEAYLAKMKLRTAGVGRDLKESDLTDLWLYWKYIVRQLPLEEKDFWFLEVDNHGSAPGEPEVREGYVMDKARDTQVGHDGLGAQTEQVDMESSSEEEEEAVEVEDKAAIAKAKKDKEAAEALEAAARKHAVAQAALLKQAQEKHVKESAQRDAALKAAQEAHAADKAKHEASLKNASEAQSQTEARLKANTAELEKAHLALRQQQAAMGGLNYNAIEGAKERERLGQQIAHLQSEGEKIFQENIGHKHTIQQAKEYFEKLAGEFKRQQDEALSERKAAQARIEALSAQNEAATIHINNLNAQLAQANVDLAAGKEDAERRVNVLMNQVNQALEAERIRALREVQERAVDMLAAKDAQIAALQEQHRQQMEALIKTAEERHAQKMADRPAPAVKALREGSSDANKKARKQLDVEFTEAPEPETEAASEPDVNASLPGEKEGVDIVEEYRELLPDYGQKDKGLLARMNQMGTTRKFAEAARTGTFPSIDSGHEMQELVKFIQKSPAKRMKLLDNMGIPKNKQRQVQHALLYANPMLDYEETADASAGSEIDVIRGDIEHRMQQLKASGRALTPDIAQGEIGLIVNYLSQKKGGVFRKLANSPKGRATILEVAQVLFHTFGGALYETSKPAPPARQKGAQKAIKRKIYSAIASEAVKKH